MGEIDISGYSIGELRRIASDWHGGQGSALYSFASTGVAHYPWEGMMEVDQCLQALDRGIYDPKETDQLRKDLLVLRRYFELEDNLQSDDEDEENITTSAMARVLTKISQITEELEDRGMTAEASQMHQVFMRVAKSKEKENIPTNPELWESCKNWAKDKYDVWPSAYALGAASKRYKAKGGKWKKED